MTEAAPQLPDLTLTGLLDAYDKLIKPDRPMPARLEAGSFAHAYLKEIAGQSNPPPRATETVFGVPVAVVNDIGAQEWRMIGRDGEVLDSGTVQWRG